MRWHRTETLGVFEERTRAWKLPIPKKPKSDYGGDGGRNPYYQNPDGSPKSEAEQQALYDTIAPQYDSSGNYVGTSPVSGATPAPPPPSKVELLQNYRKEKEKREGKETAEERREEAPSVAESLEKASGLNTRINLDLPRSAEKLINQQTRKAAKENKRALAKREATRKINETVRPAIDEAIDDIDPGSGRATSQESAQLKDLTSLRDSPKRQRGRDLWAAAMSREDWKENKGEHGVTTGIRNPWSGVTDKTAAKKQSKIVRRLAKDADGTAPLFPSDTQAQVDAENYVEEALGLGMTPADIAMMTPLGWPGRALKVGKLLKGGVEATETAAKAYSEGENLYRAGKAGLKTTKAGKAVKWYRGKMEQPAKFTGGKFTRQQVARGGRRGAWGLAAGAAVATGQADDMVKGTLEANVGEAAKATAASGLSLLAFPLTAGAALSTSARRGLNKVTGDYEDDWSDAAGPTTGMAKAFAEETKDFFGTYWSGDADDIREATEKYGYIAPINAGVMTGAAFKGVGSPLFRNTIGRVPVTKDLEGGWSEGRRINEVLDAWVESGKASVINARAGGWKEGKVARATKRFSRAVMTLNEGRFREDLRPFREARARGRDREGVDYQDVDEATVAIYALGKGFEDGKLTKDRIRKLLASDEELKAGEADILRLAQYLPDDFWDPKTKLGKQVAKMQAAYQDHIDPALTKGIIGEDGVARMMEGHATIEQITRGEAALGLRPKEDILRAPDSPAVAAAARYEDTVTGKAEKDLRKREKKLRDREVHLESMRIADEQIESLVPRLARARRRAKEEGGQAAAKEVQELRAALSQARKLSAKWKRMSHAEREGLEGRFTRDRDALAKERQRHNKLVEEVSEAGRLTEEEILEARREAGLQHESDYTIDKVDPSASREGRSGYRVTGPDGETVTVGTKADAEALVAREVERANAGEDPEPALQELARKTRELDDQMAEQLGIVNNSRKSRKARANARRQVELLENQIHQLREEAKGLRETQIAGYRQARFEAAKELKGEEKRKAIEDSLKKEFLAEYSQTLEDRAAVFGITPEAGYVPWRERPKPGPEEAKVGERARAPGDPERREGSNLAVEGLVDRRAESIIRAVEELAEREKQRIIAAHTERNGMWTGFPSKSGGLQLYITKEEFDSLPKSTRDRLTREYKFMRKDLFRDAGSEEWKRGFDKDALDKATHEAMNPGEQYGLVRNGFANRIGIEQRDLSKLMKAFETTGRWSARLTLGTSIGWLITQPFAEILTLMASNPNPASFVRNWKVRKQMLEHDPEAAELLRFGAGTVLGTDVSTTARRRNYAAEVRAIQHMKATPAGQLAREFFTAQSFGSIDRWKGAMIREIGTLMEIERNQKASVRAGKATWGFTDAIEKVADKMDDMTQAERVRYLWSDQGLQDAAKLTTETRQALAAGEQIIENVDRQQGNWTAMRPGEDGLSSLVFFYPFIRFSLKWTFMTYPADHPARYATLLTLGAFNAQMVEEILGNDPMFLGDLAMAPTFDKDGKIMALTPISRLMLSGNPAVDVLGGGNLANALSPPVDIGINALTGKNAYGEDLEGLKGKNLFSGLPVRAASVLDQIGTLSPLYREVKRMGLDDISLPVVGSLGWDGRNPQVGDDPNDLRATVRRVFGPAGDAIWPIVSGDKAGIPADVLEAKALYQAMFESYADAQDQLEGGYSPEADKARLIAERRKKSLRETRPATIKQGEDKKIRYWLTEIEEAEARYDVFSPKVAKLKAAYMQAQKDFVEWRRTDPGYRKYMKEKQLRKDASLQRDSAAYAMDVLAKEKGLEGASVSKSAVERGYDLHHRHQAERPRKVLDMASGNMVIRNGPHDIEGGYKEDYWQNTVPRGGRAWGNLGFAKNLAFEVVDPMTGELKLQRPGDDVPPLIESAFEAREFGTPGYRDGGTSFPPAVEKKLRFAPGPRKFKQANKILTLRERVKASAGGVPSGVPKKYRPAVAKWGTWLEEEMRKNGLVEKDDSFVGGGLPKGMSGPEYLAKIIQGESNWNADAGNGIAFGLAAFTPETRQALMDRTGTDAYAKDNESAVKAAAELLSGSVEGFSGTMEGYNPGFPTAANTPAEYRDGTWGYYFNQDVGKLTGNGKPDPKLQAQLDRAVEVGKAMRIFAEPNQATFPVKLDPSQAGTDLKGVNRPVRLLAKYLARSIGEKTLPILSGKSNHSLYTTTGSISEHGEGNALDIYAYMDGVGPGDKASQKRGDKIAMNAIVALGGTPKEARKYIRDGRGIYDAPKGQVIWGTNDPALGGDHTDHVHVSARELDKSWLPPKEDAAGNKVGDKLPGPLYGSRNMVRRLVGAPVRGDKVGMPGESGVGGGDAGHDATGMHSSYIEDAYAQDINGMDTSGWEREPAFDQATVTTIAKNMRKMGSKIPADFPLGENWTGEVIDGYEIELLTAPHGSGPHIHVGAKYVGGGHGDASATGVSIMERAKLLRYGLPAGSTPASSGSTSASSPGGGSTSGAGQAPAGAGGAWDALQSFRIGSNPSQKVPLWGGGTSESGSSDLELPFLAEQIGKGLKIPRPKVDGGEAVSTSSDAGKLGLPTFRRTITKRKKRNLA